MGGWSLVLKSKFLSVQVLTIGRADVKREKMEGRGCTGVMVGLRMRWMRWWRSIDPGAAPTAVRGGAPAPARLPIALLAACAVMSVASPQAYGTTVRLENNDDDLTIKRMYGDVLWDVPQGTGSYQEYTETSYGSPAEARNYTNVGFGFDWTDLGFSLKPWVDLEFELREATCLISKVEAQNLNVAAGGAGASINVSAESWFKIQFGGSGRDDDASWTLDDELHLGNEAYSKDVYASSGATVDIPLNYNESLEPTSFSMAGDPNIHDFEAMMNTMVGRNLPRKISMEVAVFAQITSQSSSAKIVFENVDFTMKGYLTASTNDGRTEVRTVTIDGTKRYPTVHWEPYRDEPVQQADLFDGTSNDHASTNSQDGYFKNGDYTGVSFAGADLTRAIVHHSTLQNANMANTILDGATFVGADLRGADLTGASWQNTIIGSNTLFDAGVDVTALGAVTVADLMDAKFGVSGSELAQLGDALSTADLAILTGIVEAGYGQATVGGRN